MKMLNCIIDLFVIIFSVILDFYFFDCVCVKLVSFFFVFNFDCVVVGEIFYYFNFVYVLNRILKIFKFLLFLKILMF